MTSRIYSQQPGGAVVREHAVLCCSTRRRREKTAGSLLMIHCRTEAASGQTKEGLGCGTLKSTVETRLKTPSCWRPRGSLLLLPRSRTWNLGRAPPRKQLVLLAVTGPAAAASSAPTFPAGPTRKTSSDKLKLETGSGVLKAENYPFRFSPEISPRVW